MKSFLLSFSIIFSSLAFVQTSVVQAETKPLSKSQQQNVQQVINKYLNQDYNVEKTSWVANSQLIEVVLSDMSVFYLTADLGYANFDGQLFKLEEKGAINLTKRTLAPMVAKAEQQKDGLRKSLMGKIADDETVLFKAEGKEKAVINVFTDIDCGYCRKLHKEVPELNEMGITVRYLAYPRAGQYDDKGELTRSFKKIKSVWCNDDRKKAMTQAKQRRNIAENLECEAPIKQQMMLGQAVGVQGTPSIVLSDGRFIGGYLPADELVKYIEDK